MHFKQMSKLIIKHGKDIGAGSKTKKRHYITTPKREWLEKYFQYTAHKEKTHRWQRVVMSKSSWYSSKSSWSENKSYISPKGIRHRKQTKKRNKK